MAGKPLPRSDATVLTDAARDLLHIRRPALALPVAEAALAVDGDADAHTVLAAVLDALGECARALPHWRAAAELRPDVPQFRYNLALALLRLGHWQDGLVAHEARIDKPDWTGFAIAPSRVEQRHRLLPPGGPVQGRRILVLTEQGLGDCVMFARYVPLLAARGARIVLACSPSLRPFFAGVAGIAELISPPSDQPLAKLNLSQLVFDAWVPLLSLPLHFATTPQTVPVAPWLRPDPARVAAWRARYAAAGRGGARKIGLVIQANPASANCVEKSWTIAEALALRGGPGIDLVNLQHGPAGRDLATAMPEMIDATARDMALDEYAAALAATDLLVSIDTMAAHLAGAIGHPAWVAVPLTPHWYWGNEAPATPWYPQARLFRQARYLEWTGVLAELGTALAVRSG